MKEAAIYKKIIELSSEIKIGFDGLMIISQSQNYQALTDATQKKLQKSILELLHQEKNLFIEIKKNAGGLLLKEFKNGYINLLIQEFQSLREHTSNRFTDETENQVEEELQNLKCNPSWKTIEVIRCDILEFQLAISRDQRVFNLYELITFCDHVVDYFQKIIKRQLHKLFEKVWPDPDLEQQQHFIKTITGDRGLDLIFKNDDIANKAYDILIKSHIIDTDFKFDQSFDKSVIVLWYRELEVKSAELLNELPNGTQLQDLLNAKFKNLKIHRRALYETEFKRSKKKFGSVFKTEILELAQFAQQLS